jgi:asparagine synthase (glutamine-hydrolysing)
MGFSRLGIIDPGAGSRPITSEDGRVSIAFNGEIYNHRELRAELQARGHVFATRTDTEVVVHLYQEVGAACVHRLRGMFAFAVLDGARLLLARDRLGIKPLHYALDAASGRFLFASEIKAILQCAELRPSLDVQAVADAMVLTYPAGTRTFVAGIRSLAAGHTLTVTWHDGVAVGEQTPYFTRPAAREDDVDLAEAQRTLEDALEESVELHLAADVEVGLTLSGGIDSSILALLARRRRQSRLLTFSVADHEGHPDLVQAARIAGLIGSEHHPVVVDHDAAMAAIPALVAAEEQPCSLYGLTFQLLCGRIAEQVKVCLHGEGADELFGGYRDYIDREFRVSAIRYRVQQLHRLGMTLSDEAAAIAERLTSAESFDDYLDAIFRVNQADALERHHLDPVDKSAMASGVEMRVPYLDDRVFDLVARLPLRLLVRADLGIRKYVLRHLGLERFGPQLRDTVLRQKLGVPSSALGLVASFDRLCDEVLPSDYVERHEFGACFATKRQLVLFDMFVDMFIVHRGDRAAVGGVLDYVRSRGDCAGALRELPEDRRRMA